jgi:serine protease Do
VTLEDGRTFSAESVHTDSVADLAIIKINAQDLPALQIGDSSKMQVGQWVVAIGNSLGMGISATKGMVSALGVSLSVSPGQSLDDLIQTDAAINPGNSGGPLVNLLGEIVGINSVKIAQVGVEGRGYAISIKGAKPVIDELIKNGYVVRPYLGAGLYTVDQYAIYRFRLPVDKGALVTDVASGSPADKAGIQPGDVITTIDGNDVGSAEEVTRILQSHQVGQQIQVTFYRGNAKKTVAITLTQAPPA